MAGSGEFAGRYPSTPSADGDTPGLTTADRRVARADDGSVAAPATKRIRVAVLGLAALLGVVALGAGSRPTVFNGAPPITLASERPVVIATLPCTTERQATASGFVLADGLVVTVAHAIHDAREVAVRDGRGNWFRPAVRYLDLESDLAVLEVPQLTTTSIETRWAERGESVRVVGGATSGTVDGRIIRRVRLTIDVIGDRDRKATRRGYELGLPIAGGDSGAALLDDQDRLTGVVFARSTTRDSAWATAAPEITAILERRGGSLPDCEPETGLN